MRRIDLHEAQRRFDEALAAAPERTALRAEALLAAAAIDFRSGDVRRALAHAEESYAVASEIGDAHAEWRALQIPGRVRSRERRGRRRDAVARARARAARGVRASPPAEAICVYSLGVAHWILGDLARAEELVAQSIDLFGALAGSPERISSPVNIAEIRTSRPAAGPGCASSSRTRCSRSSRSPATPPSATCSQTRLGSSRARGDLARARALLDESAARFEDSGDERGKAAVLVRRAYLELAEGDACGGPRGSRGRRSSCVAGRVTGAVSGSCSPGSG